MHDGSSASFVHGVPVVEGFLIQKPAQLLVQNIPMVAVLREGPSPQAFLAKEE
jgi:hypothetical protein